VAGEGKTVTAVGLAFSAVKGEGKSVLLVEADVRRASLEGVFKLPTGPGLGEWLTETMEAVPVRKLVDGPYLLTAGHLQTPPVELLGSARMEALLVSARTRFDLVVVDCPPLTPIADSVVLQDLVDGFLFVARARWGPRDSIGRAFANLKPDRVLAALLNDVDAVLPHYDPPAYRHYERES
jgi:Mrp family chromosome partitioning ATPase